MARDGLIERSWQKQFEGHGVIELLSWEVKIKSGAIYESKRRALLVGAWSGVDMEYNTV